MLADIGRINNSNNRRI